MDPGYPAPISNWNWGSFGAQGIDAALYSGRTGDAAIIAFRLAPLAVNVICG